MQKTSFRKAANAFVGAVLVSMSSAALANPLGGMGHVPNNTQWNSVVFPGAMNNANIGVQQLNQATARALTTQGNVLTVHGNMLDTTFLSQQANMLQKASGPQKNVIMLNGDMTNTTFVGQQGNFATATRPGAGQYNLTAINGPMTNASVLINQSNSLSGGPGW